MKIAAIIAEYNPFHNGHLYQIETLKKELSADRLIIVMSGDFVQRGTPALVDKYHRTHMALNNGADLVFELPSFYALGSAEYFAQGAVALLDKLGVVDVLYFGSECGDIKTLSNYANLLSTETPEYKALLNKYSKQGDSFPVARNKALNEIYPNNEDVISSPNNILGIEYIKALLQRNSSIAPATLERKGSGYSSSDLSKGEHASANAIRNTMLTLQSENTLNPDKLKALEEFLPSSVYNFFVESTKNKTLIPLFADDFSAILHYKMLSRNKLTNSFSDFYDINVQLSNTLSKTLSEYKSFTDFALKCKSKNVTYTRISRCLMHVLLDMKQETIDELKTSDYIHYARLLGFSENGKDILKSIKSNSDIPVITKPSKALKNLNSIALTSFNADINASNIYQSVRYHKGCLNGFSSNPKNELTREIIKLPAH